jgi:alpha,alpha-trehalase
MRQTGHAVALPGGLGLLNRFSADTNLPRPESYKQDVATAASLNTSQKSLLYQELASAAETGWDFSSRWFADAATLPTTAVSRMLPADLNAVLLRMEGNMAFLHSVAGHPASQVFVSVSESLF